MLRAYVLNFWISYSSDFLAPYQRGFIQCFQGGWSEELEAGAAWLDECQGFRAGDHRVFPALNVHLEVVRGLGVP